MHFPIHQLFIIFCKTFEKNLINLKKKKFKSCLTAIHFILNCHLCKSLSVEKSNLHIEKSFSGKIIKIFPKNRIRLFVFHSVNDVTFSLTYFLQVIKLYFQKFRVLQRSSLRHRNFLIQRCIDSQRRFVNKFKKRIIRLPGGD